MIPARNEAGTVGDVMRAALRHAAVVLVIDGHSTDNTVARAEACGALVVSDDGRGKGSAIRLGLRLSRTPYVVFMDADGSHEADDIPRLVAPLAAGVADLVVASRMLGGSDEFHGNLTNYVRMVGAGFITLMINWRFHVALTDCANGFRPIRREAALALGLTADDFDIEQEMVIRSLRRGFIVEERSSHEYERRAGVSKLPTSRGIKFLWRLFCEIV
ncbi:MAG: glycosyltransferase family 2 protein [candidate division WOR-3 bacterium]